MMYLVTGALRGERPRDIVRRSTIVALVSFLTLIDLFGSQALLPQLVVAFDADPQVMGIAVNASTFGMALSGLVVAWFADRTDRKRGIWISLALLSIPTFFLGVVDSVSAFMALRVLQGVFMAAAFTLTLTYLSEQCDVDGGRGRHGGLYRGQRGLEPLRQASGRLRRRPSWPVGGILGLRCLEPRGGGAGLCAHRIARQARVRCQTAHRGTRGKHICPIRRCGYRLPSASASSSSSWASSPM